VRKVVTARIRKWKPARLLDVASGTGDLALEIQDQCPDCAVTASDFCAKCSPTPPAAAWRTRVVQTPCNSVQRPRLRRGHRGLRPAQHGGLPGALREMLRVLMSPGVVC